MEPYFTMPYCVRPGVSIRHAKKPHKASTAITSTIRPHLGLERRGRDMPVLGTWYPGPAAAGAWGASS